MSDDQIQRFLFDGISARGEIVRLHAEFKTLIEDHDYPDAVKILLGEAMAAVSLLVETLKFKGKLTLQIQGDGDISLLVMQADDQQNIRGMAQFSGKPSGESLFDLFGKAQMTITLQGVQARQGYQGVVTMDQSTLAACLEGYFQQSEQLDTHIQLYVDADRVVGLFLQAMPETSEHSLTEEEWQTLCVLSHTLGFKEVMSIDNKTVIQRLFSEYDVRLFDAKPVNFSCACSKEKIDQTLIGLGQDELVALLEEEGVVQVDCEFCLQRYEYDSVDIALLFSDSVAVDINEVPH